MTSAMINTSAVCADIMEAFKVLYAEQGMQGVSANKVAEKSGYSRSTLYRHFESVYDMLRALEDEALPKQEFKMLTDRANSISVKTVRSVILDALNEREESIKLLLMHEQDNNYLARLAEILKPVFRAQLERVYKMEPIEYDILAEYITYAKGGILRYWARNEDAPALVNLTALTDSLLEFGLWDRAEAAFNAQVKGEPFERESIIKLEDERPWADIHHSYLEKL